MDGHRSQELPEGSDWLVTGQRFEVDFGRVYLNSKRLIVTRLGYKVNHKCLLKGRREGSPIWRYGVELEYIEDDGKFTRLWLCKDCHLSKAFNDAKVVCGRHHVTQHMMRVHRIDPATGLMTGVAPTFSSPFEAARAAGSGTMVSHTPWQEEALQGSLID